MAAKTEVEIGVRDKASAELKGIQGAFERMRVSVETNSKGINKLDGAFRGLGAQAAALPGPFGRIADALADFAPGGLAGGAALAGFGAIALAINHHKKQQEEITKLQDEVKNSANEQYLAYVRLTGGVEAYNFELNRTAIIIAKNDIDKFTKQLADIEEQIRKDAAAIAIFNNDMGAAGGRVMTVATQENAMAQARNQNTTAYLRALNGLQRANAVFANATADQTEQETESAKRRQDGLRKVAEEAAKLRRSYEEAGLAQRKLFEQAAESAVKQLEQRTAEIVKFRTELQETLNTAREADIARAVSVTVTDINKSLETLTTATRVAQEQSVERMKTIEPIVYGISDGFSLMVDGIMSGDNAFKAFGKGARNAIAGILRALGQQNLIDGLGALGKAFAAAANPLTAPSAPLFFKSAAQHFAAAAAAGVASRAVGGGGGAAGGGAGGFNNSQLGRGGFSTQQPLTIVIQGGLLDMSNPETQRSFVSAIETVTNRRVRTVSA